MDWLECLTEYKEAFIYWIANLLQKDITQEQMEEIHRARHGKGCRTFILSPSTSFSWIPHVFTDLETL